ncbi:unnamed protein product [Durusdinium trenchii]|uniref:Sugar phosphate phosphatase n=2 Tax=Durusdinium trenchii TaxID=1381693 RepID=A0ABP0QV60_9DINO
MFLATPSRAVAPVPQLARAWQRPKLGQHRLAASCAAVLASSRLRRVTMFWQRPMPDKDLPEPLRASDGLSADAAPEDVFTHDTITNRMPKILDSVLAKLPAEFQTAPVVEGVRRLQEEMRSDAQLKFLMSGSARVGSKSWNPHLSEFIEKGEGWHTAPWWLVENYMYKRLLEELENCAEATSYDPFEPVKFQALEQAEESLQASLAPLMDVVAEAKSSEKVKDALDATILRSLWGNQADLSLSAGEVAAVKGGAVDSLVSDHRGVAVELLSSATDVIVVLDNHGLVSDVTQKDVPEVLQWLEPRLPVLAERLKQSQADGRLRVKAHDFYTGGRAFWELPQDLQEDYAEAVVILKGDANYRRLLGDLHWPYDTDFVDFARSFWKGKGLICLRTMKSGVALGISEGEQNRAKSAHPDDWLTSGTYGQVLAFQR